MSRDEQPHDELMTRLGVVLSDEADRLEPSADSLDRIRQRAPRTSGSTAWRWAAPLAAAAVVVGVAAGAMLVTDDDKLASPTPGTSTTPTPVLPTPTSSATGPSPSSCFTSGPYLPVPTYVVKSFEGRTALYRIFTGLPHPCAGPELPDVSVVEHAVSVMGSTELRGYDSLWPVGLVMTSFARMGGSAEITLSDAPDGDLVLALQQLVHTVTAADDTITSVTVRTPERVFPELTRAPQAAVLAPVWLTEAVTEERAGSYRITMSGTASVFEATVGWTISDEAGDVVDSGFAMTPEAAPARGRWTATSSPLPVGANYTVTAFEASPEDGRITWPDTRTVP